MPSTLSAGQQQYEIQECFGLDVPNLFLTLIEVLPFFLLLDQNIFYAVKKVSLRVTHWPCSFMDWGCFL